MRTKGIQRTFIRGSNTTHRVHARSHWEIYEKGCKLKGIQTSWRAMPPDVLKVFKGEKSSGKQKKLDFKVVAPPPKFMREALLQVVMVFIVCNDQVSKWIVYKRPQTHQ